MDNNIQLPTWLQEQDVSTLAALATDYWRQVETQLTWWLQQQHSETASEAILNLLAWERGINRIPGESLDMFGKRVQLAHINAIDAGSKQGLERIFKRLGFGVVVNERLPEFDWDQLQLAISEADFAEYQPFIMEIIENYGRTCRRYV